MPIFLGAMWILGPVLVLVVWLTRKAYTSCRGGLGLWLMKPLWGQVWRQGEYQADQYAASLGKADELAQFLQTHALAMDRPMPYPWLSDYTHPPVEHRIERLLTNAVTTPRPALEQARPAVQDELPGFGVQTA
jgi:Zn-dependent protease with chaperone function